MSNLYQTPLQSLGEIAKVVIIALVIALGIRTFLLQPFIIPSGSMLDTLHIGDRLFVTKFSYGIHLPFMAKEIISTGEPFEGADAAGAEPGPLIWVQAASGGEAALVRALIREAGTLPEFVARSPRFFCTTWTAQGLEVLGKIIPPSGVSLLARYVPLDNPALMRAAVALARPACVVLLETEIWPGLMAACREAGVPLLLLNARMTPKSLSGYRLLRPLLREIRPDRVLAMSEDDAARFAEIFGPEGAIVDINFLDLDAQPQSENGAVLPWSKRLETTNPAVSPNIVAQGKTSVLGCRIFVDDELKDERVVEGLNAQTFCLVKSA